MDVFDADVYGKQSPPAMLTDLDERRLQDTPRSGIDPERGRLHQPAFEVAAQVVSREKRDVSRRVMPIDRAARIAMQP